MYLLWSDMATLRLICGWLASVVSNLTSTICVFSQIYLIGGRVVNNQMLLFISSADIFFPPWGYSVFGAW